MTWLTICASFFFQFGFVDVFFATKQFVAHFLFGCFYCGIIPLIEFINDLEGPATIQYVSPRDFRHNHVGEFWVAGLAQPVRGFGEQFVGVANFLVDFI